MNNREVKFRIWDGKEMYYQDSSGWTGSSGLICVAEIYTGYSDSDEWENCVLMQYTGLTDKNGKEIYEGDVVKFSSELNVFIEIDYSNYRDEESPKQIISEVYFEKGGFTFDWQFGYEGEEVRFKEVEVIGNKFENPGLLEDKDN